MKYLTLEPLKSVSAEAFQKTKPYPWANPEGLFSGDGFAELCKTLPDVSLFEKSFGMERKHGQKPHDRYELKYHSGLALSPSWTALLQELQGPEYRKELERLFKTADFSLRFQWQYSFRGCSVSPHCDSAQKVGSHIFYFTTPRDWSEAWGGQTLILDDEGAFNSESAPDSGAFPSRITAKTMGNRSLLFQRTPHSWHAVEELRSPEGAMRKIFTVIIDKKPSLKRKISALVRSVFPSAAR